MKGSAIILITLVYLKLPKLKTFKDKFPFLYFGHGSAYASKALGLFILFKRTPSSKIKNKIVKELPAPIKVTAKWTHNILITSSSEAYEGELKRYIKKNSGLTENCWEQFENILEERFLVMHKISPIIAVYKPANNMYSYNFSKWHKWSIKEYDKILFPVVYDLFYRLKLTEIDFKKALLIIINGYFSDRVTTNPKITKSVISRHIEMIDGYLSSQSEVFTKFKSEVLIFTNTLFSLLEQLNTKEHNRIFDSLSVTAKLLIFNQFPEKLYVSPGEIDVLMLKKLSVESSKNKNEMISDLLGRILIDSNKMNKSNKFKLLEFLNDYIKVNKVTDILAVNLLFECINAKGKVKDIAVLIFTRIIDAVLKDKKLLNNKYIKTNITLYYSENKNLLEFTPGLNKLLEKKL